MSGGGLPACRHGSRTVQADELRLCEPLAGLSRRARRLVGARLLSLRPGLRVDPGRWRPGRAAESARRARPGRRRTRRARWRTRWWIDRLVRASARFGRSAGGQQARRGDRRRPEVDVALADEPGQPGGQMRHQAAVGVDALLDVGEVAAVDDAVQPLGAADQHAGLAAGQRVGDQLPRRLVERAAVEQFDVAGGVGQQQLDGLGLAGIGSGRRRTARSRSRADRGASYSPVSDSRQERASQLR